jgi:exodeoxyribonuclease VII large subunit
MLTVTELTRQIKSLIEDKFKTIEVMGEISTEFKAHYTGHYYFTIKDNGATLDAIIWKSSTLNINTNFKRGDNVIIKGRLALYEKWGKYQIIVSSMEKEGKGNLFLEFEKMKEKLEKEGLFDLEKKKLPFIPQKLALITAKDAAALTDFLKIAEKRYPFTNIIIIPTAVQGIKAAKEIAKNIEYASKIKDVDLIVITRGGGSIEDLWAFNEEIVARAIVKAKIPIVSAIGHERDFTISDFVADKRAATPSEAAELIYPEYDVLKRNLEMIKSKLSYLIKNKINYNEMMLIKEKQKFKNNVLVIDDYKDKIDMYKNQLENIINMKIVDSWEELQKYKEILQKNDPQKRLLKNQSEIELLKSKLIHLIEKKLLKEKQEILFIKSKLELLSPFKLLEKGYALIKDDNNQPISSSKSLDKGQKVQIVLKDGIKNAEIQ